METTEMNMATKKHRGKSSQFAFDRLLGWQICVSEIPRNLPKWDKKKSPKGSAIRRWSRILWRQQLYYQNVAMGEGGQKLPEFVWHHIYEQPQNVFVLEAIW